MNIKNINWNNHKIVGTYSIMIPNSEVELGFMRNAMAFLKDFPLDLREVFTTNSKHKRISIFNDILKECNTDTITLQNDYTNISLNKEYIVDVIFEIQKEINYCKHINDEIYYGKEWRTIYESRDVTTRGIESILGSIVMKVEELK